MNKQEYKVGKPLQEWEDDSAQTLTFIVTEECNLRCKYCYVTHKDSNKVMSLDVAKKFIDLVLNVPTDIPAVVLEFIGGEPLLEAELIDQICDYFKRKTYELKHPWYWKYRISIGTNGVNYSDKHVQKLIEKNKGKIAVGITIDGVKEKHDMQRVFPDGTGSYDVIMKNVHRWLSQFPGSTKVTFASDDLPLLKESIIHLWAMGIKEVAANVVFEDVWKEGDDKIFEKQMMELADYIIENELYNKYTCTLFDERIGGRYSKESLCQTSCGAGKMLALNYQGNIYPCIRYYDHSLSKKKGYIIGNVKEGLFDNRLRVFELLMTKHQSDNECKNCEVAEGCSYCQGFCYDQADTETNFQRAKYICKMHKARVRANDYYFAKLKNKKGIPRNNSPIRKKAMLFLLGSDFVSFCSFNNQSKEILKMDQKTIEEGLRFARQEFYKPIFIHSLTEENGEIKNYDDFEILHIRPAEHYQKFNLGNEVSIPVLSPETLRYNVGERNNIIFIVNQEQLDILDEAIYELLTKYNRINLKITDLNNKFDFDKYKEKLANIKNYIVNIFEKEGILKELNVLTDILFLNTHEQCGAGDTQITYAPDKKMYICPAFYNEKRMQIGNLIEGIDTPNQHLYSQEYSPLCSVCDAFHCENCIYLNKCNTLEVNISPDFQCIKSHIERMVSFQLLNELRDRVEFLNELERVEYLDPYFISEAQGKELGFYGQKKKG